MVFLKTETIDKLCVPFGLIIGPCTVVSNVIKLVSDIAKIAFNGFLTVNYTPTQSYKYFKAANMDWEREISVKNKPQYNGKNFIVGREASTDLEYLKKVESNTAILANWCDTYPNLSFQDKRYLVLDSAKQSFLQHLNFVGIGVIRSIPVVGGAARWIYNAKKA